MAIFARLRSASRVTRFRSGERDRATDQQRLKEVRAAVEVALLAIEREEDGVKRRLDEASVRAAAIAGTDGEAYLERDPAEEQLLSEAERQMMEAARRLQDLRGQHAFFAHMLKSLDDVLELSASQPGEGAFQWTSWMGRST